MAREALWDWGAHILMASQANLSFGGDSPIVRALLRRPAKVIGVNVSFLTPWDSCRCLTPDILVSDRYFSSSCPDPN